MMAYILGLAFSGLAILPARAISAKDMAIIQSEIDLDSSPVNCVNDFIRNSHTAGEQTLVTRSVQNLHVVVRLLTPLNSNFSHIVNPVRVVVTQSVGGNAKPILPPGTILEGYVEGQQSNGRLRRDGSIILKFYWATIGGQRFDLHLVPDTANGALYPYHLRSPMTGKQKLRLILMAANKIAIPCALGSGGISLAITVGAGAVIGPAWVLGSIRAELS